MRIYISFFLFAAILAMVSLRCTARKGKRPPPLVIESKPPELQAKRPRFGPPSSDSSPRSPPHSPGIQQQSPGGRSPGGRSPGGRSPGDRSPGGRSPGGRSSRSDSPESPKVNGLRFTFPPNPFQ
ncbi:hypothetical protein Aduo_000285 [Ancylostoma duodenale]